MKLVFLDIDGVLVNRSSLLKASGHRSQGDPPCVTALNRIIAATGAYIVVSSTWRFMGAEPVRQHLHDWGVVGEVIGITPDLTRISTDERVWIDEIRGKEIESFLGLFGDVASIVIIDDDSDMGDLMPYLILTQFEVGLTEADADRAIEMLNQPFVAPEEK